MTSPLPTLGRGEQRQPRRDTPAAPSDWAAQILSEQFAYLLAHTGTCEPACSDCKRLRRLAEILLEPFRSESYRCEQSR
ncbi:MAG TPA: hypothetical protein VH640_00670 [Bryobacteraceae bacterium]